MSLMISTSVCSSTDAYLKSFDARTTHLVIDEKYVVESSELNLSRFTFLENLELRNNPFITHIVISNKLRHDTINLIIENCPNVISIPATTKSLNVYHDCKINEILENLPYNSCIKSLGIYHCYIHHFNISALSLLKSIRISCSIIETMELSKLYECLDIKIFYCRNISKITHDDPNTKLSIEFHGYCNYVLLPEHTYKLSLSSFCSCDVIKTTKNIYFPKKLKLLHMASIKNIEIFKYIPESVEIIELYYCTIDMDFLSANVREIKCSSCSFKDGMLNNFPRSIKKCSFYNCKMQNIGTFPKSLETIKIDECEINEIKVAHGVIKLDCSNNGITNIDNLPDSIIDLKCSYNPIKTIKRLPKNIENIECLSCDITEVCELPVSLKKFNFRHNYLIKVPKRPSFFCEMDYEVNLLCENTTIEDKLCYLGNCYRRKISDFSYTPVTSSVTFLLSPVLLTSAPIVLGVLCVPGIVSQK